MVELGDKLAKVVVAQFFGTAGKWGWAWNKNSERNNVQFWQRDNAQGFLAILSKCGLEMKLSCALTNEKMYESENTAKDLFFCTCFCPTYLDPLQVHS
jgi:hypothetical protein